MYELYILDGRIVIGSVLNAQKYCINKTRIWHMRLGHISVNNVLMTRQKGSSLKLGFIKQNRLWIISTHICMSLQEQ